jgi:hypothetical protein
MNTEAERYQVLSGYESQITNCDVGNVLDFVDIRKVRILTIVDKVNASVLD